MWCVMNVRAPPPFILFQGWFMGELNKETLVTDVRMAVGTFPPKLWEPGSRPGSADPLGGPPRHRLRAGV